MLSTVVSTVCLRGAHFSGFDITYIVVLKVKNEIRRQRYAEVMLEINWIL